MQRREDGMFFYEKVDWMGVADFLSAYFGEGGILISGLLKLISIWIIPKFYVALRKPLNIDISDEPTKNSSSCFYILTFHAPPFNKIISNTLIALDFESA